MLAIGISKATRSRAIELPPSLVPDYAGQVRLNFTLEVGQTSQVIEVTSSIESSLKESSASVSDVLTQSKIESLPLVGNNVLDLLTTLPGLRTSPAGDSFDAGDPFIFSFVGEHRPINNISDRIQTGEACPV